MASINKVKVKTDVYDISPSPNGILDTTTTNNKFESSDVAQSSATGWTDVDPLAATETNKSIFTKITQMIKNVRFLYNIIGSGFTTSNTIKKAIDGKAAANHTHTKSSVGLGNVDNTADSAKNVNSANYHSFTSTNELNFTGGPVTQDKIAYIGYRNGEISGYKFCNGGGNGTLVPIYASSFQGKATSATTADSAEKATSVVDYKNSNSSIKIGYSGDGLNTSNLKYIAGYTEDNGTKIKDVSKDVLCSWIGLGNYAVASHTHSSVKDIGDNSNTVFAYSKAGMNYGDYTWLAGWNGYELRSVNKNQFATASHTHDDRYYTESEINSKLDGKLSTSGGKITGKITKSTSGNWIGDRDRACVASEYPGDSSYGAVAAMATKNGYWTIGNLGGDEKLIFNYSTDANYHAGKNETIQVYLPNQSGTIITSSTIGSQSVNHADSATTSNGVKDYNDANKTIKIGFAGAGLNTSNLNYIAGYTENGTKIKDVSKDVLKQWLGATSATVDGTTVIFG